MSEYVDSGASEPAAEAAQHDLEGPEADEFREAEENAKSRGK